MELSGHVSREPLTSGEVARFRESIRERLEDANNTKNSNRTRLEQAYHAIFNCAWIALRVDGYRANSMPGHHRVVLESMAGTMGADNRDIDYFLELARVRGSDLYDAMPVSDSDVDDAIEAATKLAEQLSEWLEVRAPDS
ncbi:hypothetical protein KAJ02_02475 [Candidatus Bipolaricaulota bacterium]|nr:hypothetical protein [Candidatus Bipolaricaulota bacterium]